MTASGLRRLSAVAQERSRLPSRVEHVGPQLEEDQHRAGDEQRRVGADEDADDDREDEGRMTSPPKK
jgi:hypothetical protein